MQARVAMIDTYRAWIPGVLGRWLHRILALEVPSVGDVIRGADGDLAAVVALGGGHSKRSGHGDSTHGEEGKRREASLLLAVGRTAALGLGDSRRHVGHAAAELALPRHIAELVVRPTGVDDLEPFLSHG